MSSLKQNIRPFRKGFFPMSHSNANNANCGNVDYYEAHQVLSSSARFFEKNYILGCRNFLAIFLR